MQNFITSDTIDKLAINMGHTPLSQHQVFFPKLPLKYLINRNPNEHSFFQLVLAEKARQKFKCCYELSTGAGSLTLLALAYDIAYRYVLHDSYKPLIWFWQAIKEQPKSLIQAYCLHSSRYAQSVDYYLELQTKLNASKTFSVESAAAFAFLINYAQEEVSQLFYSATSQMLACQPGACAISLEDFSQGIISLNHLLEGKDICFTDEECITEIKAEDIVMLDPVYCRLTDNRQNANAENSTRSTLQQRLQATLQLFKQKQTTFFMFYGTLGKNHAYPIHYPSGHVLSLYGYSSYSTQYPLGNYIEHLYLSANLVKQLIYHLERDNDITNGRVQPLFYRLFEVQAEQNGHNAALAWQTENGITECSYSELNVAASKLANFLLAQGLHKVLQAARLRQYKAGQHEYTLNSKNQAVVFIYLERGPQFITAILAVMKSGAAYIPADASMGKRIAYERFRDSGADYLLTCEDLISSPDNVFINLNQPDKKVFKVAKKDFLWKKITQNCILKDHVDTPAKITPQTLAYIMYTSGSTGKPKGVCIAHCGLTFAAQSHQDLLNLEANDRIALYSSMNFDASLMETMLALSTGATLVIVPQTIRTLSQELTEFYQQQRITAAIFTPALLSQLEPQDFTALRAVFIVGDKFDKSLSDSWLSKQRQVINGYGLTEATICSTLSVCNLAKPLSIGKTILGQTMRLRALSEDEQDQASVENLPSAKSITGLGFLPASHTGKQRLGEIVIAGVSLAQGYWHDQSLTQARFIRLSDGRRLYRTGDIGYYNEQGEVVIANRLGREIKLHGQRIDMDLIEQQLLKHPAIAAVCVIPKGLANGTRRLAAYIVPKDQTLAVADLNMAWAMSTAAKSLLKDIHEYALHYLPKFGVPALRHMVLLPALPHSTSDKGGVDYKILQAWPIPESLPKVKPFPKDELIQKICNNWAELLQLAPDIIDLHTSLVAYGGDSITFTYIYHFAKQQAQLLAPDREFERDHFFAFFFEEPTIATLACYLKKLQQPSPMQLLQQAASTTVYLVHPLAGSVEQVYQKLIAALPEASIVGFNLSPVIYPTLTLIAKDYVEHIVKRKAKDKLRILIGWSSGGVIALEMARQLAAKGLNCKLLMLDAVCPAWFKRQKLEHHAQHLQYLTKHLLSALNVSMVQTNDSPCDLSGCTSHDELIEQFFNHLISHVAIEFKAQFETIKNLYLAEFNYSIPAKLPNYEHWITQQSIALTDNMLSWPLAGIYKQKIFNTSHFNLLNHPGVVEELRKLLPQAQQEFNDEEGNSLLHLAVLTGDKEQAIALIRRGLSYKAVNHAQQTPLELAALTHPEWVNELKQVHFECKLRPFLEPMQRRLDDYSQLVQAARTQLSFFKQQYARLPTEAFRCRQTLQGHTSDIYVLAIAGKNQVISGSDDFTVRVWDVSIGKCLRQLNGHKSYVRALTVLPNGIIVSGSLDKTLKLWDPTQQIPCLATLHGHSSAIHCVTTLANGRIVSGSSDKTLKLWDISSKKCEQTFYGHQSSVRAVIALANNHIVSGSFDGTIRLWDLNTGQCLQVLAASHHAVLALSVTATGLIISGSTDKTIRIWDIHNGRCLQVLHGHDEAVTALNMLDKGRLISASYDGTFKLWDIQNGRCLHTQCGAHYGIFSLAVLPNGSVVSNSSQQNLIVWERNSLNCLIEETLQQTEENSNCHLM